MTGIPSISNYSNLPLEKEKRRREGGGRERGGLRERENMNCGRPQYDQKLLKNMKTKCH